MAFAGYAKIPDIAPSFADNSWVPPSLPGIFEEGKSSGIPSRTLVIQLGSNFVGRTSALYGGSSASHDKAALAEAYGGAKAFVDFLSRHADPPGGLVRFGYYGDWLSLNATATPAVSLGFCVSVGDALFRLSNNHGRTEGTKIT